MSDLTETSCPQCAAPVGADDLFCEGCSADLSRGRSSESPPESDPAAAPGAVIHPRADPGEEIGGVDAASVRFEAADPSRLPGVTVIDVDLDVVPDTCRSCGGQIARDGYCEQCGSPAVTPRDHWVEAPAPWVAMVCDRGLRHSINQDGAAVAARAEPGSYAALVVCDGVSSAARSEIASLAAARSAREVLIAAEAAAGTGTAPGTLPTPAGPPPTPEDGPVDRPIGSSSVRSQAAGVLERMRAAGAAAQEQALAAASDPLEYNPPACTYVSAVIEGPLLVVGWVGDSRAYWLPDQGPALQLSEDDSWAGEAMALGLTRAEAERAPQAHAITRWLGHDAPDPVPRTDVRRLTTAGWVLVCSDGLWNYCSEAAALQALVRDLVVRTGSDVVALAEALVAWANAQGGQDNITVALARLS